MDDAAIPQEAGKPSKLLPLLAGLLLSALLGGAAFYVTYAGLFDSPERDAPNDHQPQTVAQVDFLPLDPILVSLAAGSESRHLRFRAELEVVPGRAPEVESLMPRIVDVMNGYLRAVEAADLEQPTALIRLRAQLLRRIQLVVGDGRVRDLLVTEFVLN
ncbi:flagellar basal body-associated FliL family protein [Tropicimonas sp.]|uniref:flagellar basal body-associated FliL family protein n=1 Tax=Tropicimonas sp. TaxID=2067044 RepID=UPI003A86ADBE